MTPINTVPCKHCGSPIVYFTLESGRTTAFDSEPNANGNGFLGEDNVIRIVTKEPKELRGQLVAMDLYKTHRCKK